LLFETGKQKAIAAGVGAVAGLTLLGGAAFAQTPGGTSTPSTQPTATATATTDGGSGGEHKDGKDCPYDHEGSSGGSNSSGT
jgi:hypothetical protein